MEMNIEIKLTIYDKFVSPLLLQLRLLVPITNNYNISLRNGPMSYIAVNHVIFGPKILFLVLKCNI